MRFGFDGQEPLTLKQIASEIGISRERVRQIADEALRKLNSQLNDDRPTRFFRHLAGDEELDLDERPARGRLAAEPRDRAGLDWS
jgi:hypothetical protein